MTVRGNPLPAKEHEHSFTPLLPPPPPILLPFLSPHLRFTIVSDHKKEKRNGAVSMVAADMDEEKCSPVSDKNMRLGRTLL